MTVWFLEFRTAVSEDDDIAHDFSLLSFLLTFCSVHLLMLVRCIHILVISIAGCSAVLTRRLGWGWGCIRYPSTLSHSVTHSLTYSLTHTHNHPHSLTDTHTDTHTQYLCTGPFNIPAGAGLVHRGVSPCRSSRHLSCVLVLVFGQRIHTSNFRSILRRSLRAQHASLQCKPHARVHAYVYLHHIISNHLLPYHSIAYQLIAYHSISYIHTYLHTYVYTYTYT